MGPATPWKTSLQLGTVGGGWGWVLDGFFRFWVFYIVSFSGFYLELGAKLGDLCVIFSFGLQPGTVLVIFYWFSGDVQYL